MLHQALEQGASLGKRLYGTRSTDGTAHTFARLRTLILLLWRNESSTEGTLWILTLVFLTILRPPVIYQVFTHERLAAIGTTGNYMIAVTFGMIGGALVGVILTQNRLVTIRATGTYAIVVTFGMIGRALVRVILGIVYRSMAGSTDKMLWMPYRPQSRKVIPID
jgi:hypothetical protein